MDLTLRLGAQPAWHQPPTLSEVKMSEKVKSLSICFAICHTMLVRIIQFRIKDPRKLPSIKYAKWK